MSVDQPNAVASHRSVRIWVGIIATTAFGPYVHGHIDMGQVAVSLSALGVLIFGWPWIGRDQKAPPIRTLVLWGALYAIIIIATISPPENSAGFGQMPVLNALGAYGLPLALFLLAWYWKLFVSFRDLTIIVSKIFAAAMAMNALLALYELVNGSVQSIGFIQQYWSLPSATGTLGQHAAINGRYIGIFYQPAIAGIAYGVALFCLIYLARMRERRWNRLLPLLATLVFAGGLVSVSKVFLIGSLPVALVLVCLDREIGRRVLVLAAVVGSSFWMLLANHLLPSWKIGSAMLGGLLNPQGSVVTTLTAGRYGGNNELGPLANSILHISPWLGFGAGGLSTAYDSLWIETLAVSGIALLVCVFVSLFAGWLHARRWLPITEWRLAGAILILGLDSSFGVPSLIGGRVSIMLWLIIGFLCAPSSRKVYLARETGLAYAGRVTSMDHWPGVSHKLRASSLNQL